MTMDLLWRLNIASLEEMKRLGQQLAAELPKHCVIGLRGTLGAGKTFLVQSIAQAMGYDGQATSPTFTLIQTYQCPKQTIHHVDTYRVADEDEFLELGIEELMYQPDCWVVIEWADRMASLLPEETLWVEIQVTGESSREVAIRGNEAWQGRLELG